MSHFTRVKTKIMDPVALKSALTELKYGFAEGAVVRGYLGAKLTADIVVRPGGEYDIGFERTTDGSYQIVADWWGVEQEHGLTEQDFLPPVMQRYAYHKVVAEVAKQGFQVVQEVTGADKSVKVTVRRWT